MAAPQHVPSWVTHGKLRWVWALWEPLAHYRRQGGNANAIGVWNARWNETYYERMHSEEIVIKLADMGINLVSTAFFKGFGLEVEAKQMAQTAEFVELCHSHGIRVLGYHQISTVIYETLLKEVPELESWVIVGPDGKKDLYGGGVYWRWVACPTCDEHIEYLKTVVTKAIGEAKLDGVEWDGGAVACHCERCQARFREYLARKYQDASRADIERRFGISFLDYVRIPSTSNAKDPLYQELVGFHNEVRDARLKTLHAHVRSLNEDAITATYLGEGALGDASAYLPDLIIEENWDLPHVREDEGVINRVQPLKIAQAVDRVTLSTSWFRDPKVSSPGLRRVESTREVELDLAEYGAYGGQVAVATWALRPGAPPDRAHFERPDIYEPMARYMAFYRDHEELYEVARSLANVAVYRSYESLIFDARAAYPNLTGFSQALIWHQIPYSLLLSSEIDQINAYDVVAIPGQRFISDKEISRFEAYVEGGGKLIVAGSCATNDEILRERERPGLQHLAGHPNVSYLPGALEGIRGLGTGRKPTVLYVPHNPPHHQEIDRAVRAAAGDGLPIHVAAHGHVSADIYEVKSGAVVLHLINYDNETPVEDIRVRVNAVPTSDIEATRFTPDEPESDGVSLPLAKSSDAVEFTIASLGTYSCVKLETP